MNRLQPALLDRLPAGVARPLYDRGALQPGIVHLGAGAFQRAHLAAINEAALHATGDLRWGIVGVSLRQAGTHEALHPQAGLYTLATRDTAPDGSPRETLQVIGNLLGVLVAPHDPAAVIEQIAHSATRILSLTITEKGYRDDPSADLADARAPRTAIGYIVRGLQQRHARGLGPLTLMSLDNLPANGDTLRGLTLHFAGQVDPGLQDWIASACSFPNSMVDRIVPRTTDEDRARVSERLGLQDTWPVLAEPFLDWAVEDRFVAGRPEWQHGGARFVAEAAPFEQLKLRMVNGTHSALAYLGAVMGCETVDEAVADPAMHAYLEALMQQEIAPSLQALPGLNLAAYQQRLLLRFANPALQHRLQQIAMDGSQKLPQRLLSTLRDRLQAGEPIERLALAVAGWLHYLRGKTEAGHAYAIDDPMAAALAAGNAATLHAPERERVATFCALAPVFGDLGSEARFVDALTRQAERLRMHGVRNTLLHAAG